jgi:hypothetical protein
MASPTTNAWVNPPPGPAQPTQARSKFLWVVGEQQTLSWVTTAATSSNISLSQATENGSVISIYYMLIIFNYATLKQTNKYNHFRNSHRPHPD